MGWVVWVTRFKVLLFRVFCSRFFIFFTVSLNRIIYEKMKMLYGIYIYTCTYIFIYINTYTYLYIIFFEDWHISTQLSNTFGCAKTVLKLGIFGQPAGRKIPMPGLHVRVMRSRLAIGNMLGGPKHFSRPRKMGPLWFVFVAVASSQKFQWTLKLDFQLDV